MMNGCDEMENLKGKRYRKSRRKTRLEKWLIVISILLMFVLVAMAIFIVIALYSNLFKGKAVPKQETVCNVTKCSTEESKFSAITEEKSPSPRTCNTHLCVQEAAEIIDKIDFDVPPCQNFYRFACGRYAKNNIPSKLDNTRDVISDIETDVNRRIRGILDGLNNTRRWENEMKMKRYYKSCIDMRRKGLSTREIAQNILKHLHLEEPPYLQLEEKLAIIMANGGRNTLFDVEFEGMNTVMLQEPKTVLRENYLLSEDDSEQAVEEYRRVMLEIFSLIGFSSPELESDVDKVLDFETSIAEIARDQEDDEYSLVEISQVESVLPSFKWLQLFESLYQRLERVNFRANDINVVLKSPGYLEELIQLLHDTEPKVVENYVMWSFLFQFLYIFDVSLSRYYHNLAPFVNIGIKDVTSSDWESCVLLTKSKFSEPLYYLYAREVISDAVLKKVNEIDKDIKHSLEQSMLSERWKFLNISNDWREKEFALNIPYKDIHAERPGKLYSHVRMSDDFIANTFQMEKDSVTDLVIAGSLDVLLGSEDALAIRPLYEDIAYDLPLAVLHPPYMAPGMPSYSTYAALGFPLAKKLTGYLRQLGKSKEMKAKENSTSKDTSCIETEYAEFLRSMEIEEEANTATLLSNYQHSTAAINIAFDAYNIRKTSYGDDEMLPGLQFDPDQLFFIRHAGLMCEVWTEDTKKQYLRSGRSPAEFSVNSVLRNSEGFARAFGCPEGSNMNQSMKCLV